MKRILVLLVGACLAMSAGVAGAFFTARTEVADSVIRAGTVAISAEPTSAALSIDTLAPGTIATKPLTVVNDGNLPVTVVLTAAKKAGITDFYEALTCRVVADGTLLYDGPLTALRTVPVAVAPAARQQLQVSVGLPAEAGNDLVGDYVKVSLYVDAEQAR
jgi:hypothetical protein